MAFIIEMALLWRRCNEHTESFSCAAWTLIIEIPAGMSRETRMLFSVVKETKRYRVLRISSTLIWRRLMMYLIIHRNKKNLVSRVFLITLDLMNVHMDLVCYVFRFSVLKDSCDSFTHIIQGCFMGIGQSITMTSHERYLISNHHTFNCLFKILCGPISEKHQSSHYWPFVRGIHRWPVNSPHKGPVTRK